MRPVLGIDLGTSYSCVVSLAKEKFTTIPDVEGTPTTRSVVGFSEDGEIVGAAALEAVEPENVFYDLTRLIGRKFNDEDVLKRVDDLPFRVAPNTRGDLELSATIEGNRILFSPEEVLSKLLSHLKTNADDYHGLEIEDVVLAVPAHFDDRQCAALQEAVNLMNELLVTELVLEPVAAALCYCHQKQVRDGLMLVVDFGAGSLKISVVEVRDGGMPRLLASGQDFEISGDEIDNLMVQHFAEQFEHLHGIDIWEDKRAVRKLRLECETAKRRLCQYPAATIGISALVNGVDFKSEMTRATLEEMCRPMMQKIGELVGQTLAAENFAKNDVDHVVVVGGASRMPCFRRALSSLLGREVKETVNTDEAVARGAALYAQKRLEEVDEDDDDVGVRKLMKFLKLIEN